MRLFKWVAAAFLGATVLGAGASLLAQTRVALINRRGSPVAASASLAAVQPGCLHGPDPTPEQKARRSQLISMARSINDQQNAARQQSQEYTQNIRILGTIPEGVELKLAVGSKSYGFSIVDTTDRCRSGVFSNQDGLIYTGQALQ